MYKSIIRPLLFLLQPESIHKLVVVLLKLGFKTPFVPSMIKYIYSVNDSKLERDFCGLKFKNPVGFAAGFDKNADIFNEFSHFGFSFIEIGTVTPKPQPGNPKPRSFRLKKDNGLINRMGFNNKGVDYAAKQLQNKHSKTIIGGNLGKNTLTPNSEAVNDYIYTFNQLYEYVDYLVVNVSCPNITDLRELQDRDSLEQILVALVDQRSKREVYRPILLKVSPDLNNNQLDDIISLFKSTHIDGIVATNTSVSRENLLTKAETIKQIGNGGLSGKPISKRSTEVIHYLHEKSNGEIPIIGVGGIFTAEDAIEKLRAGATLVQLYTGFIYEGPSLVKKINKKILVTSDI